MKRLSFVEKTMVHWRIVVAFVAVLVAYGTYSFVTMPRQEFPEFTIRQGLVVGVMPGATPEQVEKRLTKPLEEYLFGFNEVNKAKTYSLSQEGRVVVFVELDDSVNGPDAPAFWAKLRHGLNEFRSQALPAQVLAVVGNNDFGDTSALLFTIAAPGYSPRDLETHLDVIESHLRRIPATAKLRRYGLQDEVIRITISRDRLARYAVKPAVVWLSLQGLGATPMPARLDTDSLEMPIHVGETLRTEQELGDTILISEPTGSHVRLRDVATITREYGHADSYVRYNGTQALMLSIEMQKGNDIVAFGDQVDAALAEVSRELPPTVQIARVADQPKVVRTAVNHFMRDFGLAIVAVIAVTMLLLPFRVASVAALTIPITILSTLGILNLLGVELHTVSLAGLIVVLGMVVDNAIVIVDDHIDRLDKGATPWQAAWTSTRSLVVPVFTATLAIVAAYAPMAWLMAGMGRDFIGPLPTTIAVSLGVSLVIAVTLVPILDFWFIKRGLHRKPGEGRRSLLDLVESAYDWCLDQAFVHPWLTLAVGAGAVVGAVFLGGAIPQQLFPKVDRNQFAVEVYLPAGRPLAATDGVVRGIEQVLLKDSRTVNVTSFIGTSSPRFHTVYAPSMPARNYAQLLVNTRDDDATVAMLEEYSARFRGAYPEGWVRWKQLDFQSDKAPIEVRLSGDDLTTLRALASKIEAGARQIPGATWVRDDFGDAVPAVAVVPDPDACARLGVSPAALQLSLAVGSRSGVKVGTVWEGDYPVSVLLADDPKGKDSIAALTQQYVSSSLLAAAVPLEQLARVQPSWTDDTIVRRNGVRTLSVRVDVAMNVLATDVQRQVDQIVAGLGPTPGVRIEYGGEKQAMVEQYGPLTRSLVTSIAIIYLILLVQFHRNRKVLLVMMTMPLSVAGAMLGLHVTGNPFGFTSFMGIISLMGIVVRNGIILVGYAEHLEKAQGLDGREAALAAGKRRMRPIFLTSAAAAVGVVPMILSRSTLWAPLGAVTCFGLICSMVLTLFVLPVAYWRLASRPGGHPSVKVPDAAFAGMLVLALLVPAGPASAQDEPQGPLTLQQCRELAARRNGNVVASREEVTAARQTAQGVATRRLPQVSAGAMGLAAWSPLTSIETSGGYLPVFEGGNATSMSAYMPSGTMTMAEHGYAAAITAMHPLYTGGRVKNGMRLAELGVDVARDRVVMAQREAEGQTEEKYWRLVELSEKGKTLTAYQELLATIEKQANDALDAGLTTRNVLLKVQVARRKADVDRLKLDSGTRLSARDLRLHIGLAAGDRVALGDVLAAPADPTALGTWRDGGVDRRPEIRQLQRAVQAEELQAELKRGEMKPTVAVGMAALRYQFSGLSAVNDVAVIGTVSVPISGRWEASHGVAAHQAKASAARTRLADAQAFIGLEIEKRWDDLGTAWASAQVAESAIEQAETNLREERDKYDAGLTTLSDVLEAEVLVHQAQDQRIEARRDYWLARSAYLRAVGKDDKVSGL